MFEVVSNLPRGHNLTANLSIRQTGQQDKPDFHPYCIRGDCPCLQANVHPVNSNFMAIVCIHRPKLAQSTLILGDCLYTQTRVCLVDSYFKGWFMYTGRSAPIHCIKPKLDWSTLLCEPIDFIYKPKFNQSTLIFDANVRVGTQVRQVNSRI